MEQIKKKDKTGRQQTTFCHCISPSRISLRNGSLAGAPLSDFKKKSRVFCALWQGKRLLLADSREMKVECRIEKAIFLTFVRRSVKKIDSYF
jgi:hypothetical protein